MSVEDLRLLWMAWCGCGKPEVAMGGLGLGWKAWGGCRGPGIGVDGLGWAVESQ